MRQPIISGEDNIDFGVNKDGIIATLRKTIADKDRQIVELLKCLDVIQVEARRSPPSAEVINYAIFCARYYVSQGRAFRDLCAEDSAALDQRNYEMELRD